MRDQFEAVGQAFRNAADQMVALAKLTPHRVMRELYEQYIAYSRAYADSIATYSPADDNLALVAVAASNALNRHLRCNRLRIGGGAGATHGVPPTPSQVAPVGNPKTRSAFFPPRIQCVRSGQRRWMTSRDTADWTAVF